MRLGKREIDHLTCPEGRRDLIVFDDDLPGFGLRVTAAGAKTFLFQYQLGGRQGRRVRMVLGRYGAITPTQARKLAEAARGKVRTGQDPQADRVATIAAVAAAAERTKRQAEADSFTFGLLIERWRELGLADRSATHREEAPRALRTCFATLLDRPVRAIDVAAAQRQVDRVAGRRPVMARRARDYARAAYNWAIRRRLVADNPFAAVVVEGRERSRERVLSDAELAQAWRAAGIMAYPFGPFFRLLMLTLQRRGEVAGMQWAELSPDHTLWTIPGTRTKNGKAHLVHLPPPARAILSGLPRRPGNPFVFTTTPDRTPLAAEAPKPRPILGFSDAAERLRAAMALRWDALDTELRVWTIPPPTGSGAARIARLSDAARATLLATKRRAGSPFVFADGASLATDGLAPTPGAADDASGAIAAWRIHDFRRTGVTVLARLGVAPHVADRLLNHLQGTIRGVAAIYQRHEFLAERKAALTLWADHVLGLADTQAAQAVVEGRAE